jgi:hypothetical protein
MDDFMPAITNSRAEGFPIGVLSKRSGVNIETIRYYEPIVVVIMMTTRERRL